MLPRKSAPSIATADRPWRHAVDIQVEDQVRYFLHGSGHGDIGASLARQCGVAAQHLVFESVVLTRSASISACRCRRDLRSEQLVRR